MKWRCPTVLILCLLPVAGYAQMTALLRGTVTDPAGSAVADARLTLANALTGFRATATADGDGHFQIANIPFQSYTLTATGAGFRAATRTLDLRSNIPQSLDLRLELETQTTHLDVNADPVGVAQLLDTQTSGTRTELNRQAMEEMPIAPTTRGLESIILSVPGFAANANGAIHPRGAHNQMTYVIDGMAVSDQLTGAFGNSIDASVVQSIELFTGNIPAEFGAKVSGVAVITTRTGLGSGRRFSGNTQLIGGGFDTAGNITQVTGGTDKWGYFGSFNAMKTNRYLDQVGLQNLHNGGNSQRSFARFDYHGRPLDQFRLNIMTGRASFELANLPSQHLAGQNQRQYMQDFSISGGWLRTLGSTSTLDTTLSYRTAEALLIPSPGDTPVTAEQERHLATINAGTRWNRIAGRHSLRAGGDIWRYPVREYFRFAQTSPIQTPWQTFRGQNTGSMYAGFFQDSIRLPGNLQLTLGLRYDNYRFLYTGDQWQPRLGLAWHIPSTGTVLRVSYNRTYQTPPNENLLLSNTGPIRIRPERQNVYEAGLQQAIGRRLSLNTAIYHKNSRDMQDNDNFLNTGIIFPITLAQSRTNGAEARLSILPMRGLSGSLSFTHIRTIVTPPFSGGLFQGSDPVAVFGTQPFVIDHDQPVSLHGLVHYAITRRVWVSTAARYDSGLVSNPSDPAEVAADPDFRDLLPYVNLTGDPARVRPRTITDVAVGIDGYRGDKRRWDLLLQCSNIFDRTALYNFQSIFVGTRLVAPRAVSVKLRWHF